MKENINKKRGFTIIEVVLVLAIAGLIFLMVFVALPALQRSQRDTARRNDLARVDTSLVQYQTNNQGTNEGTNLPLDSEKYDPGEDGKFAECTANNTAACKFLKNYMNSGTSDNITTNTFQDPDGTYYKMDIKRLTGSASSETGQYEYDGTAMDHTVHILVSAKCDGEKAVVDTARHFAIIYRLEGAGTYCIDDQ